MLLAALGVCVVSGIFAVARSVVPDVRWSRRSTSVTRSIGTEKTGHRDPEAWIAAWQEASEKAPSTPDDRIGDRPDPVPTAWGEGIHGQDEFSFPSSYGYEFVNVWWHDAGDVYLTVLAGSTIESNESIVQILQTDPLTLRTTFLPTLHPDLLGPVRIVDAEGMTLVLESRETGKRVSLGVEDRTFRSA